jgi:hypothetical protein
VEIAMTPHYDSARKASTFPSTWITRMSVLCSSRGVAKLCRKVCSDTRLSISGSLVGVRWLGHRGASLRGPQFSADPKDDPAATTPATAAFGTVAAALVAIGFGVWAVVPTKARVPSTGQGIEPLQIMMNAKGLPTAEAYDHGFVFH